MIPLSLGGRLIENLFPVYLFALVTRCVSRPFGISICFELLFRYWQHYVLQESRRKRVKKNISQIIIHEYNRLDVLWGFLAILFLANFNCN